MANNKTSAAGLSVASNTILIVIKLIVGFVTGSVAILSEAAHSAVDLLAAIIAFFSVRASDRPADADHPFGHGKIENISGTIEAILIFGAAALILFESWKKIFEPEPVSRIGWGVALMGVSVAVNTIVSAYLFKVARKYDSVALEADAQHLRVDVWTSASVLIGLAVMWILGLVLSSKYDPLIARLDPVIALVVAIQIVRVSWKLTREAGAPLMDSSLPGEEMSILKRILLSDPRVVGFHKLRTRKAGAVRHIDVHLLVPEDLSVSEAHDLAEDVEDQIRDELPPAHVITHVEPSNEENLREDNTLCRDPDWCQAKISKEEKQ